MNENDYYSNQFNQFFPDQSNHQLQQQTNHFPLQNSNITTTNNGLTSNMFDDQQYFLQPIAPMNNIATTGNDYPILMPPESLPLPYYINTNNINSYASLQEPIINYSYSDGVNQLEPNWEAINAFLTGHVLPGADVNRVYHCAVCNVEFVNPQALGGHMSSHSTGRKNKKLLRSTKPTKFKRNVTKRKPNNF